MDINNVRNMDRMRHDKWKNKEFGNPKVNVRTMAAPHFNCPSHTMHLQLQTRFPVEPPFMFNAPHAEYRHKGYPYGMMQRKGMKKRRILAKKKIYSTSLHAPLAPRNTTSFIMRAKKHGGIASAVTPSPVTPAVLPTPLLSPGMRDKGSLEEMNKELGVNGYGSMNGLIRLRSNRDGIQDATSEMKSDVEHGESTNEIQSIHSVEQLDRRIDQGLSRFEMIYPSLPSTRLGMEALNNNNCMDNQKWLILQLEEENVTLRERVLLVEQQLNQLRRRVRNMEGLYPIEVPMEGEHCEESCGDVSAPCQ